MDRCCSSLPSAVIFWKKIFIVIRTRIVYYVWHNVSFCVLIALKNLSIFWLFRYHVKEKVWPIIYEESIIPFEIKQYLPYIGRFRILNLVYPYLSLLAAHPYPPSYPIYLWYWHWVSSYNLVALFLSWLSKNFMFNGSTRNICSVHTKWGGTGIKWGSDPEQTMEPIVINE